MRVLMAAAALLIILAPGAGATVLATAGATWPIAERDALEEIEARAAAVDWRSLLGRVKAEAYRPAEPLRLPRAGEERTFLVDPTWTLPFDIPDGRGGILYPRGYAFNPLDYVPFAETVVVLDGSDPEQVEWFRASPLAGAGRVMLLLTDGAFAEVAGQLHRHVYYADRRLAERFRLAAVPAVIARRGRLLEVREIALPNAHRR